MQKRPMPVLNILGLLVSVAGTVAVIYFSVGAATRDLPPFTKSSQLPVESARAFLLGYDLGSLIGTGTDLVALPDEPSDTTNLSDFYRGQRHTVVQDAKLLGIEIETSFDFTEPDFLGALDDVDSEIGAKLLAIEPSHLQPYDYGIWTGLVVPSLLVARDLFAVQENEEAKQFLDDLISFNEDLSDLQDLNVSDEVKEMFRGVRAQLDTLSQTGFIGESDLDRMDETILGIDETILGIVESVTGEVRKARESLSPPP